MRWELTEEQAGLQESVRGWLDSTAGTAAVRQWLDAHDAATFTGQLAVNGWLDIGLGENRGGQGGGLVELALVAQELGSHAAPSGPWLAFVIARAALEPEQGASQLVGPIARDGRGTILAIDANLIPGQKPAGGPDSSQVTVSRNGVATPETGVLSGTIPAVLGASSARTLVIPIVNDNEQKLYAVEADAEGVEIVTRELLDRSRDLADVRLKAAVGTLLDAAAEAVLARAAQTAGVLLASDSVGAMQVMLDRTVKYTSQRHQFGVPVGSFQAVKHGAAEMLVSLEAGRSIAYYSAASVQAKAIEADQHAAVAKAQATAEGASVAETALTLHGAIGYTWEHDLHLFYKRAKLNAYLYGSVAAWNERLAARLR